jgi:hypothetical protein
MFWLKDYRLAGYLVAKGFPIAGTRVDSRNDVELGFDDVGEKVSSALQGYPGSVEHRYDTSCKSVHDLIRLKLRNRS